MGSFILMMHIKRSMHHQTEDSESWITHSHQQQFVASQSSWLCCVALLFSTEPVPSNQEFSREKLLTRARKFAKCDPWRRPHTQLLCSSHKRTSLQISTGSKQAEKSCWNRENLPNANVFTCVLKKGHNRIIWSVVVWHQFAKTQQEQASVHEGRGWREQTFCCLLLLYVVYHVVLNKSKESWAALEK